jgi:hypothetical protein
MKKGYKERQEGSGSGSVCGLSERSNSSTLNLPISYTASRCLSPKPSEAAKPMFTTRSPNQNTTLPYDTTQHNTISATPARRDTNNYGQHNIHRYAIICSTSRDIPTATPAHQAPCFITKQKENTTNHRMAPRAPFAGRSMFL